MKKKRFLVAIVAIMAVALCAMLVTACDVDDDMDKNDVKNEQADIVRELQFEQVYAYAQEAGYTGTLEELVAAFKGDSAYQVAVKNGYNGSEADWLLTLVGASGKDGITPNIGANGNWYIGDTDTGVPGAVKGEDGRGITQTEINASGQFVISYSDGTQDVVGSLEHGHVVKEAEKVVLEASCEHDGVKYIICETCSAIMRVELIPKLNHDYIDEVVAPTETLAGYTKHTCKRCGDVSKDNYVEIGDVEHVHQFASYYIYDGTQHWKYATCGHEEAVTKSDHEFDDDGVCRICGYRSEDEQCLSFAKIDGKNEYAVDSCIAESPKDIIIPSSYNGKPVTQIYDMAFYQKSTITSVTIPESITAIGDKAFYECTSLKSIDIPSSVESIGEDAFSKCQAMQTVNFAEDSALKEIKKGAFESCTRLTTVGIPDNVTALGSYVFSNCTALTTVVMSDKVDAIEEYAFNQCSNLANIRISESAKEIGNYAFSGCSKLTAVYIPGSVETIGNYAFSGSAVKSVTFGDDSNCMSIGEYAFNNCTSLLGISIPDKVTSLGAYAFNYCTNIARIRIPNAIENIGNNAFDGCNKLVYHTYDNAKYLGNNDNHYAVLVKAPTGKTTLQIHENTAVVYNYACCQCLNIKELTIPANVIGIGSYAFGSYYTMNLESVTIEDGSRLKSIGGNAFSKCSKLVSIALPASVSSIGASAFNGCSCLTSATFAENSELTSIGEYAFYNCSKLDGIKIPQGVTFIGNGAFCGCSSLTSIEIPAGVTSIESSTFNSCSSLTSITFAEGNKLQTIGECAFYGCNKLADIEIPASVTMIDSYAFYDCYSLTSITIPASVTNIGVSAFRSCSKLTSITFENVNNWYRVYENTANSYNNWANKTSGSSVSASSIKNTGAVVSIINEKINEYPYTGSYNSNRRDYFYYWYRLGD